MNKLSFPSHQESLDFIEILNKEKWEEFSGLNIDKYLKETSAFYELDNYNDKD